MKIFALTLAAALAGATGALAAPVNGTGNVTPDVIFGSGNANGSFTGETRNNIEVGLRGKQRYPAANVFNYDGVDTYTFDTTALTTNPTNRSVFNFEWSVNVDADGSTGDALSDFDHWLSFDLDPTPGVSLFAFDPFNTSGYVDHAFGDNFTGNGGGTAGTNTTLVSLTNTNNVAQQSSNLGFGFSADPDLPGSYAFKFEVFEKGTTTLLASSSITINATPVPPIPVPAALPLMATALAGFGLIRARRKR